MPTNRTASPGAMTSGTVLSRAASRSAREGRGRAGWAAESARGGAAPPLLTGGGGRGAGSTAEPARGCSGGRHSRDAVRTGRAPGQRLILDGHDHSGRDDGPGPAQLERQRVVAGAVVQPAGQEGAHRGPQVVGG